MGVFKLTLKIDRKGAEVFEETKKDAEELNKELSKTGSSAESFKEIEKTTASIGKNIDSLTKQISGSIRSVVSQTVGAVSDTTENLSISFGKTMETILGRMAILGVGVKIALSQSFLDFKSKAILQSTGLFSFIAAFGSNAISSLGGVFSSVFGVAVEKVSILKTAMTEVSGIVGQSTGRIAGFVAGLFASASRAKDVAFFFGKIGQSLSFFTGSATVLFGINLALKESVLLVKRFFGFGVQAAKPLERVTNIVVTIDNTFRSIGLTTGGLLRTLGLLGLSVAGFGGPVLAFATGLAGINSLISNTLALGTRFRLRTFAFFGSARAQIGLILLDLKRLALDTLPTIADKAKSFKVLQQNAKDADKSLKKVGDDVNRINQATAVKRGNLPIQKQFALFALEVKTLFAAVLQSVNTVSLLLKGAFKFSDVAFKNVTSQAKKATDTTIRGVEKTSNGVQDIFERGTKTAGVFGKMGSVIRRTFLGKNPIVDSLEQSDKAALKLQARFQKVAKATENGFKKAFKFLNFGVPNFLGRIGKGLARAFTFKKTFGAGKTPQSKEATARAKVASQATIQLQIQRQITAAAINTNKQISKTIDLTNKATKAKISASVIQIIDPKKIKPTQKSLGLLLRDFIKLGGLPIFAPGKGIGFVNQKQRSLLNQFGAELQKLVSSGKKFSSTELATVFKKLQDGMQGFVNAIPKGAGRDKLKNFLGGLTDPKFLKIPANIKAVSDGLKDFKKIAASELGVKKFKGLGDAISGVANIASKSFSSNKILRGIENSVVAFGNVIASFLKPKSPPKKGPLNTIDKWGVGLVKELTKGMFKSVGLVGKAALALAKRIAGFFPQSPALFGPLVALPKAGFNIGMQLVSGMKRSFSAVGSAAASLGQVIFGNLTNAFQADLFSERFGIGVETLTSFNLALSSVGASTTDLQFSLTGLNRILNKTLTQEDKEKFASLGLDLEKAKNATEPTAELLFQISSALDGIPPQAEKFGKTLEAAGLIATSPLINFLQIGRPGLEAFQQKAVETGTVLTSAFTEAARKAVGLLNQLKEIRKTFLNPLIEEILPVINSALEDVIDLFQKNQRVIESFLRILGKAFGALLNLIFNFVRIVVTEPRKAFEIVSTLASALALFLKDIFFILLDELVGLITRFVKGLGPLAIQLLRVAINKISSFVLTGVGLIVGVLFTTVDASFIEGLKGLLTNVLIRIGSFTREIALGLAIGISDGLKSLGAVGEGIGDLFGFILTEQDVSNAGDEIKRLEKNSISFTSVIEKVFTEAAGKAQTFGGVTKEAFAGVFDEKAQAKLKNSLGKLTGTFKTTFGEIANFKITNTDLTKSISEAGDLFKEKFGDGIELAFGESAREKTETFFSNVGDKVLEFGGKLSSALNIDVDSIRNQVNSVMGFLKNLVTVQEDSGSKRQAIEANRVEECEVIAKKEISCAQKKFDAQLSLASQFNGAASKLASGLTTLIGKESEELFIINKAFAVSQAIINTAQGVSKALAEGGIAGIALGALVAAAGAIEIANISAQQPPSLEVGGMLGGPSHSQGGIPVSVGGRGMVEAEGGEFVVNKLSTNVLGPMFMNAINSVRSGSDAALMMRQANIPSPVFQVPSNLKFESGGLIPGQNPTTQEKKSGGETRVFQNVNLIDPDIFDSFLATNEGIDRILNIISNNPESVRESIQLPTS